MAKIDKLLNIKGLAEDEKFEIDIQAETDFVD